MDKNQSQHTNQNGERLGANHSEKWRWGYQEKKLQYLSWVGDTEKDYPPLKKLKV